MTEDQKSLVHNTVRGTAWNYATFVLGKAVTFAATIVLARVLSPENFGLMSLALIAINYLDTFGELGVGSAVIYKQDNTEKNASVAFTLAMVVNILLAVISFAIAPTLAAFFNEPQLTRIIQALSVTFILSGLGRIHEARLKKELAFRKTVIPELAKTTAKAVVSIGMGLLGYGVWSLVWGQIAGSLVVSILYWRVLRWRPRLSFDITTARQLVSYSGQIVLAEILGMIQNNLDYLIIGKRLDSLRLGYYTMAFRVPELLIISLCHVVSQALFPAYAKLQDKPEAIKKGFLLTLQYTSLFTVPVGVGLFFITPEFVEVVFSDQWLPAIPAMQALALYALVYSLSFNAGDVYKATGRPDILNKLSIVKLGITIPALWVAAGYSIYAVALAQLLANLILTAIRLGVIQRLLSLRLADLVTALKPAFSATLVMGAGIYLIRLGLTGAAPLARLIVIPIAGLLLYGLVIRLAYQELTEQLIALVQNIFLRKNSLGGTAQ